MHQTVMLAIVASLAKRCTTLYAVFETAPFTELMSSALLFEPA